MFTCYVIDDEPSALEILEDYISIKPNLTLLKTFANPLTALGYINKAEAVDIIFLDIEMLEMSGLELVKLIGHKAKRIVFVTAHKNYAYDSIELEAAFLLKPVSYKKFDNLVSKVLEQASTIPKTESFLIKKPGNRAKKFNIKFNEVIFIESQVRHTKIQTIDYQIISDQSFAKLSKLFTEENFIRVHRSFIVSKPFIKIVGNADILMVNDIKIPIGRNYRNGFVKVASKNNGA
ncbi:MULTISPECIES: LytTR family DNA-binding domain-containing protein [unclassified Pedobacter]|uniref:LytR/AlgR family response regulator transcription factor n=1 Tax=unclassified Pedobacter TaxID=2628915 RepID=UPI001E57353C|nr:MULTISPECIES: LytTR family DNA-binding domain-containing protein [unclassified Pedobacter]